MNDTLVWFLQFILPRRYWYRNLYLWSNHWKTIRKNKLKESGHRCENCKKPRISQITERFNQIRLMDVHHLTYERLFRERLSDLKVLCRTCHKKEHAK